MPEPPTPRRLRLFVALELPGEIRAELARWRDAALARSRGWRALDQADLHVTLCFLGAQNADSVPAILTACAALEGRPAARLELGDPLWLPRRRPRVMAVEMNERGGGLTAVQAELAAALTAGGWYRPERRPFLAHVTVARLRPDAMVATGELAPPPSLELVGQRFTLYRSVTRPDGARYEPLGSVALSS